MLRQAVFSDLSTCTVLTSAGEICVAGDASLVSRLGGVCIVGARAATRAGREKAREIAAGLARAGVPVWSGGALGIDAAAHAGALSAGGSTVAVVAGGARTPYPSRNLPLFEAIVAAGGAVASPFGESTPIRRWQFVKRNQVLAELCRAVLVVEAGPRSGSLYTVAAARAARRPVAAVPGSPATSALLYQGAARVESADDLLEALAGRPSILRVEPPEPGSEAARVLDVLDANDVRAAAQISELSGMTLREAQRGLVALELSGLAMAAPGGGYRRTVVGS